MILPNRVGKTGAGRVTRADRSDGDYPGLPYLLRNNAEIF
jgi:hypothetical protein